MSVVVSGIGVVTSLGIGIEDNIAAFRNNISGIGSVTLFDTDIAVPVFEVKHSNTELKLKLKLDSSKTISRTALLGMLAAQEAMDDASIIKDKTLRIGIISSTSVGGMDLSENFYVDFLKNNSKGRLRNVVSHDCADSTEKIAKYVGINHYISTLSTACSSAANAIMFGARLINNNILDCALVGGTDALCKFTLNGFNSLMILDEKHCSPFDENRGGLNLGEGAGYLLLQSEKTIKKTPYCKLAGFANANDAFHQTASSPEGIGNFLSMKNSLQKGGLSTSDIDYINVHGTGTNNNDLSEGTAIVNLFGEKIPKFSSTKAFVGHTLAAAGGVEAVYSVLSIDRGIVYPNLNFKNPIKETNLIPETSFQEGLKINSVMSNSFGFGGNSSCLIFTK